MVNPVGTLILLLLFILYICDYVYTATAETNERYNFATFFIDLLNLFILYFAINAATLAATFDKVTLAPMPVPWHASVAVWLLVSKALSATWEIVFERRDNPYVKAYAVSTDVGFSFCYATLASEQASAIFAAVLFLDVICYITFDKAATFITTRKTYRTT